MLWESMWSRVERLRGSITKIRSCRAPTESNRPNCAEDRRKTSSSSHHWKSQKKKNKKKKNTQHLYISLNDILFIYLCLSRCWFFVMMTNENKELCCSPHPAINSWMYKIQSTSVLFVPTGCHILGFYLHNIIMERNKTHLLSNSCRGNDISWNTIITLNQQLNRYIAKSSIAANLLRERYF